MKLLISFAVLVVLLLCLQFFIDRSLPFIGAFPSIKGKLILKADNNIVLKIRQKGTYDICAISLYDGNTLLFKDSDIDDANTALIKLPIDWPKSTIRYRDRVIFINFPKDSHKKVTLKNGMILKLQCYGSYDQYLTASGSVLESPCIVVVENHD